MLNADVVASLTLVVRGNDIVASQLELARPHETDVVVSVFRERLNRCPPPPRVLDFAGLHARFTVNLLVDSLVNVHCNGLRPPDNREHDRRDALTAHAIRLALHEINTRYPPDTPADELVCTT